MNDKKRHRGERIWEGETGDYSLHQPPQTDALEQEVDPFDTSDEVIWVHGHMCIRTADGKYERVDT